MGLALHGNGGAVGVVGTHKRCPYDMGLALYGNGGVAGRCGHPQEAPTIMGLTLYGNGASCGTAEPGGASHTVQPKRENVPTCQRKSRIV